MDPISQYLETNVSSSSLYSSSTFNDEDKISQVANPILQEEDPLSSMLSQCQPLKKKRPFFLPSTLGFSLEDIDIYTQRSFNELIQEQIKEKFPYFIALVEISTQKHFADGINFLTSTFQYKNNTYPTTRDPISSFTIYKSRNGNTFTLFCDDKTIKENNGHFAKYINAMSGQPNPERGNDRFYLSGYYEDRSNKALSTLEITSFLRKEKQWLELAAADGSIQAMMKLAELYFNRNEIIKGLQYLLQASSQITVQDPLCIEILNICLQIFTQFPQDCGENIQFCIQKKIAAINYTQNLKNS